LIINRYIMLEILKPMGVMLAVLVSLFAAYSTTHYLADAAYGLMSVSTVVILILLKILISLEVLIPVTLYLSVMVGLGRMHKDSEMTALFASGVGLGRILAIVLVLALLVALAVATLSLYARPWAYGLSFWLKTKAVSEFDVSRLQAGRFYEIGGENRFLFIEEIDHARDSAKGVFLQKEEGEVLKVVYAKEARQQLDPASGRPVILLSNGHAYEIPLAGKEGGSAVEFTQSVFSLWPKEITPLEYKIKAASTTHLAGSPYPAEIAELQWRLAAPISAILLSLLGVPLSRTTPREGKYAKLATGMFIFAIYYSVGSMAKILVEQGSVPYLPGIWWVQGVLSAVLLYLLCDPSQQLRTPRRRWK
jgi:lipopolysaccharide export system permease protein